MKLKNLFVVGMITTAMLMGGGYWYVFLAGSPQLDPPQAEANVNLHFQVEEFVSKAMGEQRRYGVILPPGYETQGKARYPVIILLHGGHGTERDYEDKAKLTSVLDDLYRRRQLPPAIVVTPDGNDHRGSSPFFDPEYFDGDNGKVDTLIAQDLVQVIQSRYRTLPQPKFWAIGGLSSGGWGAMNIGLKHLDQFSTFFSHTGYFKDQSGAANSPIVFVKQIPAQQRRNIRIYLDAGESDQTYLKTTQKFQQVLAQLKIEHAFRVFPGGHGIVGADTGWNYWHKHLADSLGYVGTQLQLALAELTPQTPPKPPAKPTHQTNPNHNQPNHNQPNHNQPNHNQPNHANPQAR